MAFDAFLKIDGIPGESTDDKHKDWIEVLSFDWGMDQPIESSDRTGGAAKVVFQNFSITKAMDIATPKLVSALCNHTEIPKIKLELCRATGEKQKYMECLFERVNVKSFRKSGSSSGDLPTNDVVFSFEEFKLTYTKTDHKTGKPVGDIVAFWNLTQNRGG